MKTFQLTLQLSDNGLAFIIVPPDSPASFICGNSYTELKSEIESLIAENKNS